MHWGAEKHREVMGEEPDPDLDLPVEHVVGGQSVGDVVAGKASADQLVRMMVGGRDTPSRSDWFSDYQHVW